MSWRRWLTSASSDAPYFSRNALIGTTALAIARWPPALPMSREERRTNSPAFFE